MPDSAPIEYGQSLAPHFANPAVRLAGHVDEAMLAAFREQLIGGPSEGPVVIELFTLGGDPEVARVMADDVRLLRESGDARRLIFLGKAAVYSAGVTFMACFPRQDRYLAKGARLMIHERQAQKIVKLDGPLSHSRQQIEAVLHEIDASLRIQEEGFELLIQGSSVTLEEINQRARTSWYLDAAEAQAIGLVQAVV